MTLTCWKVSNAGDLWLLTWHLRSSTNHLSSFLSLCPYKYLLQSNRLLNQADSWFFMSECLSLLFHMYKSLQFRTHSEWFLLLLNSFNINFILCNAVVDKSSHINFSHLILINVMWIRYDDIQGSEVNLTKIY